MKRSLHLSLIPLLFTASLCAWDNLHFYRASFFFGEPRFERKGLSTLNARVGAGSTSTAFDGCGKKVCLLDIYGPQVGFEMISKELYKFLKSVHVTEIAASSAFDPELHEAVAQIEAPEVASGDIVEVVQKGYMLGEEVLRPAKVVVAR